MLSGTAIESDRARRKQVENIQVLRARFDTLSARERDVMRLCAPA